MFRSRDMKFGNRLIFGMAALVVAATVALTVTQMQNGTVAGGKSGVIGVTQEGPTCPVQQIGQNCEQTVAATIVVYNSSSVIVAQTTSGNDGHFQVDLPAGTYTLQGFRSGGIPQFQGTNSQIGKSTQVTAVVTANQYTHVTIEFDTGIRLPQPVPSAQPLPYQGSTSTP